MGLKKAVFQFMIGIDQLLNTLFFGFADETISARAWRERNKTKWRITQAVIDRFFYLFFRQQEHCYIAYLSEVNRRQLPPQYRQPLN